MTITYDDFQKVDIRVGTIVGVEAFPEARKPAFKLRIDFGPEIGERRSSAQITENYAVDDLVGRLVLAVVNFPPKQIGPMRSEVLTLGVPDASGQVVLVAPDKDAVVGALGCRWPRRLLIVRFPQSPHSHLSRSNTTRRSTLSTFEPYCAIRRRRLAPGRMELR